MNNDRNSICILMIDDDSKLIELLSDFFPLYNLDFHGADDPVKGLEMIGELSPDLIVLDVMMPGMDGFEVCREIRKKSDIPIIMLSARGDAMDRIVGLELGADDYMAKPFEPRELVARIQSVLRRSAPVIRKEKSLVFGELEIRPGGRTVYLSGNPLELTTMEYELLYYFATNQGKKFSRDELMLHLQGFDSPSFSRSIDILVSRLRAKLGENAKNPRLIKSVYGYGYVFTGGEE